jgi:hypothetical protein
MGSQLMTRRSYVITPKSELLQALDLSSDTSHEACTSCVVISPKRDYEELFEGGWSRSWLAKAKHDFVMSFIEVWSEDFPSFAAQLRNASPVENFDKWWFISKSDLIEIDENWSPQQGRL